MSKAKKVMRKSTKVEGNADKAPAKSSKVMVKPTDGAGQAFIDAMLILFVCHNKKFYE